MLKNIILLIAAVIITVLVTEYNGDRWEQYVRTALYDIKGDPVPVYSTEITDSKGIPYVEYKTLNGITPGKQYNPTIVCNYAIRYFETFKRSGDSLERIKFFNCADWLVQDLEKRDNYALYIFNWQQPWYDSVGVPFTSGMTSGLAVKVFTLAYTLSGSAGYLEYARMLMRGFYIPVHSGGFTYYDTDGWWYEEIADTAMHTPRILDGHIFAITGLHEYAMLTKDDSARFLFNKGIAALKRSLHHYDIGNGWSYYDRYQLPADRKYHRILTAQMKELYGITRDPLFLEYYKKWNVPLSRLYARRIFEDRNISGILLFMFCGAVIFCLLRLLTSIAPKSKA